jgi:type I restriction enzyme S subunit
LSAKPYGAVIQHIEPEHLKDYLIPYPEESVRKEIGNKVLKSFELRDKSNDLIDEAEEALVKALGLPVIERINLGKYDNSLSAKNFSVSSTELNERFDASYHDPLMSVVINLTQNAGAEVIALGDRRLSKSIILPGRFKRVYVGKGNGTVFLGGKQIYELDPYNKKYLSVKTHGDRITNQLYLHENMIAITCSGTIGRINLIPKHWERWTMNQHVIRVVPSSSEVAGYIYIWLNTDFGRALIERYSYGAVIKEIDNKQLAQMPIPVINDKRKMKQINDLAIEANRLRSEAYYLEQEAIEDVNNLMSLNTMEE